ncbi:unnamed protein product [Eruca vesicaria subsp. sativa]|uniref:ATP synthase F0 subunit 8 n=1 Tax=Eruca vesicaria subsp. sativa TaxID=29727 RepID=A0ABC8JH95_ERUVS|nr:unnamed protein product [Eruca vesicaria subsp. sativa]
MANTFLYFVLMTAFLLCSVLKIWWETDSEEWLDKAFESGTALLRIGFDENQEYFESVYT